MQRPPRASHRRAGGGLQRILPGLGPHTPPPSGQETGWSTGRGQGRHPADRSDHAIEERAHGMTTQRLLRAIPLAPLLLLCAAPVWAAEGAGHGSGFVPPVWTILPFVGILLSIALFPLFAHHFWEHHYPKVSLAWLVLAIVLMVLSVPGDVSFKAAFGERFFSTYEEYIAFIILLGSLFVISGGIYISGDLDGTPQVNSVIILIGSLLASVIGTTGAAMLLCRPLLRANANREKQSHVVLFFIFLVCNIGGSLTPIGDPPLFLGFLQGIPFQWTLVLIPHWAFTVAVVLASFYLLDTYLHTRDTQSGPATPGPRQPVRVEGTVNFLLLLGVVVLVILSGVLHFETVIPIGDLGVLHMPALLRDGGQIVLAAISLLITGKRIREANNFNFEPIKEVAYLFVGIFTCMIPALMLLNARGGELGLSSPASYFWATGILSAFLDNAPTYLTFLATAMGSLGLENAVDMIAHTESTAILKAISVGAVFMGAMTYIGNGPNFMVKAIAEGNGVRMPSFFGYLMYSMVVLFPVFVILTFIFF
jgi:Na+/H+ antiporter NhaD/arsenite permease-like protein